MALPALGLTLSTDPAPAAPPPMTGPPRVIVSRTRPPAAATWLAEQLDGELVEMGSAGAKAMAVVRGEADVYAHSGGQYEWDSCAPVAVALAAGLHASRIDGSPLVYNNADPYLPDLLICRPELAECSLAGAARLRGLSEPVDLKTIRYEVDDRIATITLDRPDRLNAWTGRMHTEYRWAVDQAEHDHEVRVIVVTGAGRGFCAGADAQALVRPRRRGAATTRARPTTSPTPATACRPSSTTTSPSTSA